MPDVCIILEGTWPYLTGGVGSWTQSLLAGLPEITFSVVHLRSGDEPPPASAYHPPPNVELVVDVPLDPETGLPGAGSTIPEAALYHALSSGWAGRLGARVAAERETPLVVTDHGVAWREALLRDHGAETGAAVPAVPPDALPVHLAACAREAYREAAIVTTVCRSNSMLQLQAGAAAQRCRVIPNGVDLSGSTTPDVPHRQPLIGLVGRVVPVKDIATFLRACRLVAEAVPEARFVVIGPLDHDASYADRCATLAARLDFGDRLVFTGEADPAPWYSRLGAVVLTSRTEAQPLALLEAMAAGVPVVATAVGGVPDLLGGDGKPPAGMLVPPGDPPATAAAILTLWQRPAVRRRLVRAGLRTVGLRHDRHQMLAAYRDVYATAAAPAACR